MSHDGSGRRGIEPRRCILLGRHQRQHTNNSDVCGVAALRRLVKFDSEAITPWTTGRSLAEEHEVVFVEPPSALLRATLRRRLYGDDHAGDDDDEGDNDDDDDGAGDGVDGDGVAMMMMMMVMLMMIMILMIMIMTIMVRLVMIRMLMIMMIMIIIRMIMLQCWLELF